MQRACYGGGGNRIEYAIGLGAVRGNIIALRRFNNQKGSYVVRIQDVGSGGDVVCPKQDRLQGESDKVAAEDMKAAAKEAEADAKAESDDV